MQKDIERNERINKAIEGSASERKTMLKSTIEKKSEKIGFEQFQHMIESNIMAVFNKGHYGNWEYYRALVILNQYAAKIIYDESSSETIEKFFSNKKCVASIVNYMRYHNIQASASSQYGISQLIEIIKGINETLEQNPKAVTLYSPLLAMKESDLGISSEHIALKVLFNPDKNHPSTSIIGTDVHSTLDKFLNNSKHNQKALLKFIKDNSANGAINLDSVWSGIGNNCINYGTPLPTFIDMAIGTIKQIFTKIFGLGDHTHGKGRQ